MPLPKAMRFNINLLRIAWDGTSGELGGGNGPPQVIARGPEIGSSKPYVEAVKAVARGWGLGAHEAELEEVLAEAVATGAGGLFTAEQAEHLRRILALREKVRVLIFSCRSGAERVFFMCVMR